MSPSSLGEPSVATRAETGLGDAVTIGATGRPGRWSVTSWGGVVPWIDGESPAPMLDWWVAADDRWHVPAQESTVRQRRLEGTPVLETRIRIPDGDAVQRIWAVPDRGGCVVVEFENESPLPFAVALAGLGVVTERAPTEVPIQGIELPDDAIVLPVGHHATVRVLLPAASDGSTPFAGRATGDVAAVPPAMAVVRGWSSITQRASRLVVPDEALTEAVTAARCDLLLEGPIDPEVDPVGFVLDVAELVRCGDDAAAWIVDVVGPAELVARSMGADRRSRRIGRGRRRPDVPTVEGLDALTGALLVARRAGDDRAGGDLQRIIDDVSGDVSRDVDPGDADTRAPEATGSSFADIRRSGSVGRFVRAVERRLAERTGDAVALLPGGLPTGWLGSNVEVHGIPTGPSSTVSFALRWHGERPAVLWEQTGEAQRLTSPTIDPAWSSTEQAGEALWAAPPAATSLRRTLSVNADAGSADDAGSPDDVDRPAPSPPISGSIDTESGGSFL